MRITIVGGPFLPMPPAQCGAVERVWHGLAEEFARRGHRVTVLCRMGAGQKPDETIGGVRYVRRGAWQSGRRWAVNLVMDLAHALRMAGLLPPGDVVVTNTFWLPALLSVWNPRAGRVAVHVQRVPKGQLFLYDRVHRLQAVSAAIRDEIVRQRPGLAARVRLFPNPVDTRAFTPPSAPRSGGRCILYTGRIHPEKGLPLLVEAARELASEFTGVRLRLVGPWRVEQGGGGEEFVQSLRRQAEGLAVEFGEPVFDRAALAALYRAADYYCYPSVAERGEASPVAPAEAMATALAPVVSALPQFRDTVQDGVTGLVFDHRGPAAAHYLAAALRRLLTDVGLYAALGAAAARHAAGLSYERVADLYLADFAEILGR
jgi:glycosyltransferase involved in cell wall biosynthesis